MSREAMQMALEALELYQSKSSVQMFDDAVKALRQALETEQEPVAWISDSPTKGNGKQLHWTKSEAWRWSSNITPLYTAPPKRECVGLTDEEVSDVIDNVLEGGGWLDVARALEAAIKRKNT